MLKSKNQVTLFVNNSFYDFCSFEKKYSKQKGYVPIYGHTCTFNRYPCEWSSYFYTLQMVTNELRWCLLNFFSKVTFLLSPRTLFTSEYCPPNVPPRVCVSRWSGVIILHYKRQCRTCKDRTTAAQLTIRGEIQLTLVSRAWPGVLD